MQTTLKYKFKLVLSLLIFLILSNVTFAQKALLGKEKNHYEALNIFPDSIVVREDGMRTTGKRGPLTLTRFQRRYPETPAIIKLFFHFDKDVERKPACVPTTPTLSLSPYGIPKNRQETNRKLYPLDRVLS